MTSVTGSVIGGIIGAAVAQQEGALIGSVGGGVLGQLLPGSAGIVSDLLGGLGAEGIKQTAQFLLMRKAPELETIRNHLQVAWQDAFREAVYDIGGATCFPSIWPKRTRKLDGIDEYHCAYPHALLTHQYNRPDLSANVCTYLQQLVVLADEPSFPVDDLSISLWRDVDKVEQNFMETVVLSHLQGDWLATLATLGNNGLFDLESHLRRAFFPRLLAHLGENLQNQPKSWYAYNRLMWQCVSFELYDLATGQAAIQEQLAVWDTIGNSTSLGEQIARVFTAIGQTQRFQDEQLAALMARLVANKQHLTDHISQEHQQTRAEIQAAVAFIVEKLAGDGLDTPVLQHLTQHYQELLADKLRLHRFQGIAQFQKAIRLPLADFYLELGLLPWQDEQAEEERLAELMVADEVGRLTAFEQRLTKRVKTGLGDSQRLVILGEPGAGKTLTLHFTALMVAHGQGTTQLNLPQPYLPVLVRLADYAREGQIEQSLESFLCQHVARNFSFDSRLPDVIRRALGEGVCLVLLDGLDEIGSEPLEGQLLRVTVLERIQIFAEQWCNDRRLNRLIVTSRKEGYRRGDLADFAHVELSPLRPPDEIGQFLRRWYAAYEKSHDPQLNHKEAEARAERAVNGILPQIMRWESVRYLATNPLMLTILVLVYENVGALPDRRAKLYEICALTLIHSWREIQTKQKSDILKQLTANQIFAVMGQLAYWLHEYRPGGTAPILEWETQLVAALQTQGVKEQIEPLAQQFIHYARHEAGLLAERGLGQLGFFHLTFEEYLAGYAIAHASELPHQQKMIEAHWEDPRWREVILLAIGEAAVCAKTPPVTNHLFWTLLDREPADKKNKGRAAIVAGRALVDVGAENVSLKTVERIKRCLRETMQNHDPKTGKLRYSLDILPIVRAEAGEVLDRLGWLPKDLNSWLRCSASSDERRDLWAAKYPVTNAQFALFIGAGGYDQPVYWGGKTSKAWQWRKGQTRRLFDDATTDEPIYWQDARFGKERRGYPVVGVSWYEAVAYTHWLTALLRQVHAGATDVTDEQRALVADLVEVGVREVRLPSETEWVRLAGGETDERYPWDKLGRDVTRGGGMVMMYANVKETEIQQTSSVAMCPQGESVPFGLFDVVGNVREWTSSWRDRSEHSRVVRGGSWFNDYRFARVSIRLINYPDLAFNDFGFRVVAPVSGS